MQTWRLLGGVLLSLRFGSLVAKGDAPAATTQPIVQTLDIAGGKYKATIDTTETPDLTDWARDELAPVVKEWYPKIVEMLPSDGYEPPKKFSITFRKDKPGVADTAGNRINCAAKWFRGELKREAKGAIVHEMVHVVQQYGGGRRVATKPSRNPGWLVEGLADYIRWYQYEPQSHGCEIGKNSLAKVKYDNSYRITANFLDWASAAYDKNLVKELNAAMRRGEFSEDLWAKLTKKTAPELDTEWHAALAKKLGVPPPNAN